MVLSPEHQIVEKITAPSHKNAVAAYRKKAASMSDLDRQGSIREERRFTGSYAINRSTAKKSPYG
jgi:leucyl-tRNA synthetase